MLGEAALRGPWNTIKKLAVIVGEVWMTCSPKSVTRATGPKGRPVITLSCDVTATIVTPLAPDLDGAFTLPSAPS